MFTFTTATQLFSWQVTQAVEPSSEMVMYSGSISSATVELRKNTPPDCMRPYTRMRESITAGELNEVKSAV